MKSTISGLAPASGPEEWVRPLTDVRLRDRAELGGKSAVLGELLARGMPVLPGVAISGAAYEAIVGEPAIAPLAEEYWSIGKVDRSAAAAEIGRRLSVGSLSAEVGGMVLPMLENQGVAGDLIVRSSATAEDGRRSSFAGQFVSVRSRHDAKALAEAIATVWASATSPHVAEYISHMSSPGELEPVRMGVLIQPYLEFEVAGILFGQHPTVQLRGWALVEFLDVPPDRIVGGEVTPHRVRLRMSDGKLLWEHRVESDAVLDENAAGQLAAHCGDAAGVLGADVDMEWGQQNGKVLVLQARPATHSPWGRT
jgi:phosphoenolpyruvate synthase/pyruvate phosphate dikinase